MEWSEYGYFLRRISLSMSDPCFMFVVEINRMMYKSILAACTFFLLQACSGDGVKEKINKAGDVAGQTVGEFAHGVSTGVEKALNIKIELSQALKDSGVSVGKVSIADSGNNDNVLQVYMIFAKGINANLTAKAYDQNGAEMGRVKVPVKAGADEAKYVDFIFDPRTNIDNDSKVVIQ